MPHVRMRGLAEEIVIQISNQAEELAKIVGTDAANFTFESIHTSFYEKGRLVDSTPFVEVLWFPRDQEKKNSVAQLITNLINKTYKFEYVTVVFFDLDPNNYFENGSHF